MSFTRENLQIRQLVSGVHLNIPVFKYKGKSPEVPKAYIQANIHGAEIQGNAVIYRLMEHLEENQPLGDITLVPQCNPYAMNMKLGEYTFGRFDPTTGTNWNRGYFNVVTQNEMTRTSNAQINLDEFVHTFRDHSWKDIKLEFKKLLKQAIQNRKEEVSQYGMNTISNLALSLQELTWDADIVLDFHTGPNATRYLYAPTYARESAHYLGIPLVLLIPEEFAGALDESTFTPWSKLKQGFEKYDREVPSDFESFTVELGGEETIDFNKDSLDVEGIINYLRFRGTLSGDGNKNFGETKKACSLNNFRSYFAPSAGLVHYYYGPGDAVKKGDLLCEILSMNSINEARDLEKAKTPIYAKDDGLVVFHATSSGVHQGMEIYSLMSEVFDL